MTDCIFCKIAGGEMTADVIFEDDDVIAFRDISPKAPTHVLVIPRRHISTLNDLGESDVEIAGRMVHAAQKIALQEGIADGGYRTVINCNTDGGQAVYHIHLHLLGGRQMSWPPG